MAIFLLGKISIIKILIATTSPIILHHANLSRSSPLRKLCLHHSHLLKNHVPHEWNVERLHLAGYLCPIADFEKSPNFMMTLLNAYDEDGEERFVRGTKRKKAHVRFLLEGVVR